MFPNQSKTTLKYKKYIALNWYVWLVGFTIPYNNKNYTLIPIYVFKLKAWDYFNVIGLRYLFQILLPLF